jgi:serine/threonine protein kinase
MHDCSEFPVQTDDISLKHDKNCVKQFQKHYSYKPVILLGKGTVGSVFAVHYKENMDNQIAVKILPYGKKLYKLSNKELGVACELNSLASASPIFLHTLGYLICKKIPQEWKEHLDYNKEEMYMYMFMHKPQAEFAVSGGRPGAYKVMGFNNRDYAVSLLFVLLHGLYVGRKFLQFVHNDIHEGNVMFSASLRDDASHFDLSIENTDYKVAFISNWVPKLIDFGRSSTKNHPDTYAQNNGEDVAKIFNLFNKRIDLKKSLDLDSIVNNKDVYDPDTGDFIGVYKAKYKDLMTSKFDNYQIIAKFLLEDPLFNVPTIEKQVLKRRKVDTRMCDACGGGPAKFEYENCKEGKVCHAFCGKNFNPISHILK